MSMWKDIVRPALEDDYEVGHVLGKGTYGTVRLVRKRGSGEPWACKTISKNQLVTRHDIEDVRREVELLNLLTPHDNIAGVDRVYEDSNSVHIIIDYCEGGELFDRITAKGTFSEQEAASVFLQMVEVVRHCHSMGVVHRDIKPENFLLTDGSEAGELKACDFGLSTYFKTGEVMRDLVGSAYYVAPEVLHRHYGRECDLWSLGVVLYILLCGLPPFWGSTEAEIFKSVLEEELDFQTAPWPAVSEGAKALVKGLLDRDPGARLGLADLARDPWLRERGGSRAAPLPPMVIQRMKAFARMTKLKKAAVLSAAKYLTKDQIQGLRELFKSFDENGDGVVSFAEFERGLASREPNMALLEIRQVMEDVDVDGSGSIDYEEFIAATANLSQLEREETFIKAFRDMDKNGDGTLTAAEVAEALDQTGSMTEEEAHNLIACHDLNRDGVIDYAGNAARDSSPKFVSMLRAGEDSGGSDRSLRTIHRKHMVYSF
ncbi:hypothetical protein APUTEX25_001105 [Auxenochlorella protothecoides]|uniref:Uncharacterized protein n=1 Tax=Auxenochlorella protothecoides TaxID=3075 RepID=A0A3M7KV40_AUXPR|nr:hypothetical protein APUTEX25_001105 [Auxenochlorella protothecoides]|eukprot:RMZ52986.1 hypothetical protein APUTEX25_001105 [Auxenochlorella protothecoides]